MQIEVKHDSVAGLVAEMTLAAQRIARELEELDRTASQLQSQWDGDARETTGSLMHDGVRRRPQ